MELEKGRVTASSMPHPDDREPSPDSEQHITKTRGFRIGRWTRHWRTLRHEKLFAYLSMLATVMIIINLIQVSQFHRGPKIVWLTAFPAAVMAVGLICIWLRARTQREIWEDWYNAEPEKRVAWVGIVASMFIPIILCQFVYLPVTAVPAWRSTLWTSDLTIQRHTPYPAAIIATDVSNGFILNKGACVTRNDRVKDISTCSTSGVQYAEILGSTTRTFQYLTFNKHNQSPPVEFADLSTSGSSLFLGISFMFNSSVTDATKPEISIGLFDPFIPFRPIDYHNHCGSPPLYTYNTLAPSPHSGALMTVQRTYLNDKVGALRQNMPQDTDHSCSFDAPALDNYSYYTTQPIQLPDGNSLVNSQCDTAGSKDVKPCDLSIRIILDSMLVTTQTSSHGTTALQIYTDEGAIIGGVMFLTWFLGIYVI